jgi:hypothetical protein
VTPWSDEPPPNDESVVIDVYGIKTSIRPSDLGERTPKSWSDVRDQVRGHLLRLAVAPTRLLAELFEGTTRLVKGVSALPGAAASRIQSAHAQAEAREERLRVKAAHQKQLSSTSGRVLDSDDSAGLVERLEEILQRVRAQGRDGTVVLMRNGSILVVLGTAEDAREAIEAAADDVVLMMSSTGATAVGSDPSRIEAISDGGLVLRSGDVSDQK